MANLLLVPGTVKVRVALDPVYNALTSLYLVTLSQPRPGIDPWVEHTAASLSAAQIRTHRLLFDILYSAFEPDENWPNFPLYLAHLAELEPLALRNRFLRHMFHGWGERLAAENRLMDQATFIDGID